MLDSFDIMGSLYYTKTREFAEGKSENRKRYAENVRDFEAVPRMYLYKLKGHGKE